MKFLGIYFGPNKYALAEADGKKLLSNIQVNRSVISGTSEESAQKVPDEVKLVAYFKEEMRRNRMEAKESALAISGKDMIIRTFDMPAMPKNELDAAIAFEAKKYIPFKIEDLVFDFQAQFDRLANRNQVLFVGIKRDVLDKYIAVAQQLGTKVKAAEYSAFSILRALSLMPLKNKGITAILAADPQESDELNFLVIEAGFPLFSRDIILSGNAADATKPLPEGHNESLALEKIKTEVRVSLDYYNRKFPTKRIENLILLMGQEHASQMEAFIHELEVPAQFVDILRLIGRPAVFSLSLIKGFSVSLLKIVKNSITIDLIKAREKIEQAKKAVVPTGFLFLKDIKPDKRVMFLGVSLCALIYIFGIFRVMPEKKALEEAVSMRIMASGVSADSSYEDMLAVNSELGDKIKTLNDLMLNQVSLTRLLDIVPRIVPDGVWLTKLSFRRELKSSSLVIEGLVSLGESEKELGLVNSFLMQLKQDPNMAKYFNDISISSVERSQKKEAAVTNFIITCKDAKAQAGSSK